MAKSQTKINTARIQRAITGLQIPMLSIVALNRRLEQAIAQGATDQNLAETAREFVNSVS